MRILILTLVSYYAASIFSAERDAKVSRKEPPHCKTPKECILQHKEPIGSARDQAKKKRVRGRDVDGNDPGRFNVSIQSKH